MEIKNNTTAIEEILSQIKAIGEGTASKTEMESKLNQLKEAVEKKNAELDAQMGSMETNLEKTLAKMAEQIGGAFEKSRFGKPEEQKRFKSFGEFMQKVRSKSPELKDLAESSGESGGYLVPEVFANEILKINLENNVVRSNGARVIPMTSTILRIPALSQYSNAAGSIYGGVTAYWGKEGGTLTESEPKFDRITLEPKKLTGYCEDSNELEQDAIVSISGLLSQMFGEVLAFEEDYNFLVGDGVNKPLGILSAPCLVTVSRTTISQVVTADIVNMLSRFRGTLDRAVFVVNQTVLPSIYKLKDENNNYIWHPGMSGNITGKALGTIYGVPFVVSEKVPAVGTTGDILLADFGHYLIGDREGLRIDYSPHFKFNTDQNAYRAIKRVDGQPWLKSAITPRAGGSTLSPFVAIG